MVEEHRTQTQKPVGSMCTCRIMLGNTQGMFTYRNICHGTPPAKKYTQIINKLAAAVRPLKKHNGDAWEKQPSDDDFSFIFRRRLFV